MILFKNGPNHLALYGYFSVSIIKVVVLKNGNDTLHIK